MPGKAIKIPKKVNHLTANFAVVFICRRDESWANYENNSDADRLISELNLKSF